MKSVKVVHIVEGFTGGIVTYMLGVLPGLIQSGRKVTLIYSAKRADPDCKEVIGKLEIAGVRVIDLPFKRKIGGVDFLTFMKLFLILQKERFDVVHTHCAKAGFLGRFAARAVGAKVICHSPHCFISSRTPSRFKAKIYIWLERLAALLTHKMIFVSESERLFAYDNKIAHSRQSEVINNGLVLDDVLPGGIEKQIPFMNEDDVCVTFVGRLVQYKNPDLLVKAAVLLKNKNIKFMICGDGPDFETLQTLISDNSLDDRVCLAGYVQDMINIYLRTDIFVMCSDAEGQPYALIEAMASGCGCVGVKSDGLTDILEHGQTGLLCDKTASDIARSIENMVTNGSMRARLAKNARRYVTNSHSLENQIDSLNNLYEQMFSEVS